MSNNSELLPREIRYFVLEHLKNHPTNTEVTGIVSYVKDKIKGKYPDLFSCGKDHKTNPMLENQTKEIIWDLITQRVITPGSTNNYSDANLPVLNVTEYGKKALENNLAIPHDYDRYISQLTKIRGLDSVIREYVEESLITFYRNCFKASAVMLGCASERAIDLLLESFAEAINDSQKQEVFKNILKKNGIQQRFDEFIGRLKGQKGGFSDIRSRLKQDIGEDVETAIEGVFRLIKKYRNDAGHPKKISIDRSEMFTNLMLFQRYCEKIYLLIKYFKKNKF